MLTKAQGHAAGALCPTLCSGDIYSFRDARLMTGMERFLCQGLNPFQQLFASSEGAEICRVPFAAERLSLSQQRSLTGNSIHGHVMMAVLSFALSHVVPRHQICPRSLCIEIASDSDEDAKLLPAKKCARRSDSAH